MKMFPLHAVDFYKCNHYAQYTPGTELVYSNLTCRSDKHARVLPDFDGRTVFFGLQGLCQWLFIDMWNREFFLKEKDVVVERYRRRMDSSLGAGVVSIDHIAALHDVGFLPLLIKAVPEGSRVPIRVPSLTIQNTLPEFFWLTNYVETQLSAELWKSITSATTAFEYRRLLDSCAEKTGSPAAFVPWQGHDFAARGMSGIYDGASSGAGHLLSFFGTDTVAAIDYLEDYYGATGLIGGSVAATEHSVMCMGGEDDEIGTFRRLLTEVYPTGIVSIVSDTYDFFKVVTEFVTILKDEILTRKPDALGNAKCVFRPDSGDPVKIICGDPDALTGSPENKGAVECLWDVFGGTTTSTGHRLLDSHVGVIYGDSITLDRAQAILAGLLDKGFASANIVFGIGSWTYQGVTRDTFGTAVKATFGRVNGEDRVLFKAPKTDDGVKNSARGLLRVEADDELGFVLHEMQSWEEEGRGVLEPVFKDGKLLRFETLDTIRNRLLGS
jgi:nicotinamide phosphoribosyltransferase